MVTAQTMDQVHVIHMGKGATPLADVTVQHNVDDVMGSSPKLLFVPQANKEVREGEEDAMPV